MLIGLVVKLPTFKGSQSEGGLTIKQEAGVKHRPSQRLVGVFSLSDTEYVPLVSPHLSFLLSNKVELF